MGRACKRSDGRGFGNGRWKCFNCGKGFSSKRKWWNHLWSIW